MGQDELRRQIKHQIFKHSHKSDSYNTHELFSSHIKTENTSMSVHFMNFKNDRKSVTWLLGKNLTNKNRHKKENITMLEEETVSEEVEDKVSRSVV